MRRSLPALAATGVGLMAVLRFQTRPLPAPVALHVAAPATTAAPPSSETTVTTLPPTTARTRATLARRAPGSSTPLALAPAAPTTTMRRAAPSTAPPTTARSGTFDGPTVESGYGPVEVEITTSGSRITDVQALQLPSDRARSRSISAMAGPKLRQEALAAQSANIDAVSGASYTSAAYKSSLQGAIDAAHA